MPNADESLRRWEARALANRVEMQQHARDALVSNRAFLAVNAPTPAQVTAQVKALTRQANSLLRVTLNDTTDTD